MVFVDRSQEFFGVVAKHKDSSPSVSSENASNASAKMIADTPVPRLFYDTATQLMDVLRLKERGLRQCTDAYMSMTQFGSSKSGSMTDSERESLENDMLDFAREFDKSVSALKETLGDTANGHIDQHCDLVVLFLYGRIKKLTELTLSMRDVRTDRAKRLERKLNPKVLRASAIEEARAAIQEVIDAAPPLEQPEFTESQQQVFEEENRALLEELDSEMEIVRQQEQRIHEITELMTLFSNKVVEQEQQIENIYDNSVSANAHMERGLVQLLQSLKYGAQYRANIMFIFVVAGISLLFLDWFQD